MKKPVIIALCLALCLAVVLGGSIAYLTDTASDVIASAHGMMTFCRSMYVTPTSTANT